jgi:hypothetical protein
MVFRVRIVLVIDNGRDFRVRFRELLINHLNNGIVLCSICVTSQIWTCDIMCLVNNIYKENCFMIHD